VTDPNDDHSGLTALWVLVALVAILAAVVAFGFAGTW